MLNQGAIQRTKYEEMIEDLHEKLNRTETVNSYSGITNHALQRKVLNLEHELSLEISAHNQAKANIERLDTE
jgi:hypothetical protein